MQVRDLYDTQARARVGKLGAGYLEVGHLYAKRFYKRAIGRGCPDQVLYQRQGRQRRQGPPQRKNRGEHGHAPPEDGQGYERRLVRPEGNTLAWQQHQQAPIGSGTEQQAQRNRPAPPSFPCRPGPDQARYRRQHQGDRDDLPGRPFTRLFSK